MSYTKEFREKFEEEYSAGEQPSQILADMGIDHRILGKRRKGSLVTRMKLYELRPAGCEDTRKNNTGRPSTKELTNAERIERLEHKIAYLNQENEFLNIIFRWIGRQTGNTSETTHQIQTHQRNDRTR